MGGKAMSPKDPSRVLLLGDVHGEGGWFRLAASEAKKLGCDVILQLGDFGFWPHRGSGKQYLETVKQACKANGVECWWIDGNHENFDWLEAQPHDEQGFWRNGPLVHCGRGARWEWSGVHFLACGGAFSIDKRYRTAHESWWSQETITEADLIRCGEERCDVLVTHDAPWGADNVMGPGTVGDKDSFPESADNRLRVHQLVRQTHPRLLVHGHYHHRNSTWLDGTRIEGFARDGMGKLAFGTLDLPSLAIDRAVTKDAVQPALATTPPVTYRAK